MSLQVIAGAAMVAAALPVAWFAVAGRREATVSGAQMNRGLGPVLDLRQADLSRSSTERLAVPLMTTLARHARRFTPAGVLDKLDGRIAAAALEAEWPLERVLAAKMIFAAVGALFGFFYFVGSPSFLSLLLVALLVVGVWSVPDVLLSSRADARRDAIKLELADTMDQVTIAVEAGLGFESALARVAQRNHGVLAAEIARTLQDIQLGMSRGEALDGLATRTDVPELRQFVTAIRQAEKYGVPIANVLRVQSADLRDKRRQFAEERAMKVPIKVLMPLIFCILPSLFVVVIGPGAIRLMDSGFFK